MRQPCVGFVRSRFGGMALRLAFDWTLEGFDSVNGLRGQDTICNEWRQK
jgi:hypothetical protein